MCTGSWHSYGTAILKTLALHESPIDFVRLFVARESTRIIFSVDLKNTLFRGPINSDFSTVPLFEELTNWQRMNRSRDVQI